MSPRREYRQRFELERLLQKNEKAHQQFHVTLDLVVRLLSAFFPFWNMKGDNICCSWMEKGSSALGERGKSNFGLCKASMPHGRSSRCCRYLVGLFSATKTGLAVPPRPQFINN